MKLLNKYNHIIKFIIFILLLTTIETIINLIIPLNIKTNQIISLLSILVYSFLTGYKKGKTIDKKAYKEGFKIGLTNIIILYVLGIFTLSFKINIKRIIYYLIIISVTILGSIIGINKKRKY